MIKTWVGVVKMYRDTTVVYCDKTGIACILIFKYYLMHNITVGYTQGMNDLLSPILYTLQTEHEAFWCFVEFFNKIVSTC